jgi:hypothetical protein
MRSSLFSRSQLIQQNAILPLEADLDMTSPLTAVIGATIMVRDCASSWLNSTRLWSMLSATRRYTARRHAYLVCAFAERIRFYETLDPSTPAGQRYRHALASDPNCAWVRPETPRPEAIDNLKSGLARPGYAEAYAEYQRLSARGPAQWH